ncbi:MAG: 6-carboxytetrahydropterin synthase QueD [Nitrococcus sp.]|nr:6-carboxytetrahydropterin synthase QueD [Nitrococcus sp.]
MSARYLLSVVTDFSASHILHGHPGKCSRLHGHNWSVEVEVEARELDQLGMAIDFAELKAATRQVVEAMDHRHLNDLPEFAGINPTAEHVAGAIYRALRGRLSGHHARLNAVTVWETAYARVRYTEED